MPLPTDFIDKYTHLLGEEADDFFHALQEGEETKAFRLNTLKAHAHQALNTYLPDLPPAPYALEAYLGSVSGKSPLHQAGYVYSQEPSAMIVSSVCDAQAGECVLDLCAAPGGKSTQLLTQLKGEGLLVSNDIMPKRASILAENIERWGASNCLVTQHAPAELAPYFPHFFDRIVVDAPCSGEGMFRKDPQAIDQWTLDSPQVCQDRQKEILRSAVAMLKDGGYLIYSTCTFAPEENEMIISWLLDHYPFELIPLDIPQTSPGRVDWGTRPEVAGCIRLWPHKGQGEGHFVAKLQYCPSSQGGDHELAFSSEALQAELEPLPSKKAKKKKKGKKNKKGQQGLQQDRQLDSEQMALWQDFKAKFPLSIPGRLERFGSQLWLVPEQVPEHLPLRIVRNGLHLGTFLKRRFEPSFALALAAIDQSTWPQIEITDEEWCHYVKGETFSYQGSDVPDGWVLLVLNGMSVGFGKLVQHTVKNFFPKGLRFDPQTAIKK